MNTMPVSHDAIVNEIHATRERLAEQYGNDLLAYSRAAESHCRDLGFKIEPAARRLFRPVSAEAPESVGGAGSRQF